MNAKACALLVVALLALPSCATAPASSSSSTDTSQSAAVAATQVAYTETQVPVFRAALTDEMATLRFYDDMPHVAYINIADFYKILLPSGTLDQIPNNDGTWLLTTHTGADEATAMPYGLGGTATVDPIAGTITSPNLPAFVNTMSIKQDGVDNVYFDGVGVARVSKVEYDKPANPVNIDLGKYGIIMHADDDGIWLPVHTASTIFMNLDYDYLLYNGRKLYVNSDNNLLPASDRDPEYGDTFYVDLERPDDLIAYDYAQFCLAFYDFYGKPASASDVLKTQGLDAYLNSLGDDGKAIKDALLSKDYAEYLHGTDGLHSLLNVDEHTTVDLAITMCLSKSKEHADVYERYQALGKDEADPINKLLAQRKKNLLPEDIIRLSCRKLTNEAFGSETYASHGDTAMIVLDSFDDLDLHKWNAYLAGEGECPSGSEIIDDKTSPSNGKVDSLGIFLDGLEKAKADPQVKYVVIDVTKNDGGSDDVVMFIMSMIANSSHGSFQNPQTGQTITEYWEVDRNLDGVFDEQDALVDNSNLKFAVLTSGYSYSCGNQFPCLAKDAGVPIIGERSGGGSCSVQMQVSGDGPTYNHSSWLARLVNDAGEEIDSGVPVDVDLLERADSKKELRTIEYEGERIEAEVHDYSSFFDLENLSQVMHELYGDQ